MSSRSFVLVNCVLALCHSALGLDRLHLAQDASAHKSSQDRFGQACQAQLLGDDLTFIQVQANIGGAMAGKVDMLQESSPRAAGINQQANPKQAEAEIQISIKVEAHRPADAAQLPGDDLQSEEAAFSQGIPVFFQTESVKNDERHEVVDEILAEAIDDTKLIFRGTALILGNVCFFGLVWRSLLKWRTGRDTDLLGDDIKGHSNTPCINIADENDEATWNASVFCQEVRDPFGLTVELAQID